MLDVPFRGQRLAEAAALKTEKDRAKFIRRVAGETYPDAKKTTLATDDLKAHSIGAFYEAHEPSEAKRPADGFEPVLRRNMEAGRIRRKWSRMRLIRNA
jgi:hypothetical protein